MGFASISSSAHLSGSADIVWAAFTDPAITGLWVDHKTTFVAAPGFTLEAGQSWEEHHGAECDFDVVRWTVTQYVAGSIMTIRGKQRGVQQTVRQTMTAEGDGYRLTEDIRFRPTIAGKFGLSALSWLLLGTGILAKVADDKGESFDLLRAYLDSTDNSDGHRTPLIRDTDDA